MASATDWTAMFLSPDAQKTGNRRALRGAGQRVGHRSLRHLPRLVGGERAGLHRDEIDDPCEVLLLADGHLDGHAVAAERGAHRLERAIEARALAIEAGADDQARELELLGVGPDFLGGHLHAGDGIDDDDRRLDDAKRRARVRQEVAHPGRVDEVDLVLVPLEAGERGGEGVLAGDGLVVEVGDGRALVHLAESIHGRGVEQERRGQLRLARAAVTHERHVPDACRVEDLHKRSPPDLVA
jgi:hypothetical protein